MAIIRLNQIGVNLVGSEMCIRDRKRIGAGKYEKRELHEFYKVWDKAKKPIDFVCTYDGRTYALKNGKQKRLVLKDFFMPFKSRYQLFYK